MVLRSIAFVVMFFLAGGPALSVVCQSWCGDGGFAGALCQHRDGQAARLTPNAMCAERSLESGSFIKKEVSRSPDPSPTSVPVPPNVGLEFAHPKWLVNGGRNQPTVLDHPSVDVLRI